jgi:hypothetical protein
MKIVIFGYSGSGKSEAAKILVNRLGYTHVYPTQRLKAFLEDVYSLNPGDLENADIKNQTPYLANRSYKEQLISLFHFYKFVDPYFTYRSFIKTLQANKNRNVVITGVRHLQEMEAIASAYGNDFVALWVNRYGAHKLNTDTLADTLYDSCPNRYALDNDGGIKDWETEVLRFVTECNKTR